jgi:citrate lyase beta subunit
MDKSDARPLRTVLFAAGSDLNEIEEAYSSGADSIVIDLEEPRTPFPEPERVKARQLVRNFLDNLPARDNPPLIFSRCSPRAPVRR